MSQQAQPVLQDVTNKICQVSQPAQPVLQDVTNHLRRLTDTFSKQCQTDVFINFHYYIVGHTTGHFRVQPPSLYSSTSIPCIDLQLHVSYSLSHPWFEICS